jgi:hypothetical protein
MKSHKEVNRMRTLLIVTLGLSFLFCSGYAQVTIKEYNVKENAKPTATYDSLTSSVSNPEALSGQEIFWLPKTEKMREYPIYKVGTSPHLSNSSKMNYDEVANKYYRVREVLPQPKDALFLDIDSKVLKLEERESKNIIYYLYEPRFKELIEMEFVLLGYMSKLKTTKIGSYWILRRNFVDGEPLMIDMNAGNRDVDWKAHIWKCVDVAIESRYYTLALILENDIHQQIPLHIDRLDSRSSKWVISIPSKDYLEKKFGRLKGKAVAEGKAQIGMTLEMCKYAWGEPEDINTTITGGKTTEQWVYGNSYLYFTDGFLTAIQN